MIWFLDEAFERGQQEEEEECMKQVKGQMTIETIELDDGECVCCVPSNFLRMILGPFVPSPSPYHYPSFEILILRPAMDLLLQTRWRYLVSPHLGKHPFRVVCWMFPTSSLMRYLIQKTWKHDVDCCL